LLPFVTATLVWAAGSILVLRHVMRADDFVMAEVRRHGLVADLVRSMLPFLFVYLAVAWLARFAARRVLRFGRRDEPSHRREALVGTAAFVLILAVSTVQGMRELPAVFAGLFYEKGGVPRSIQLAIERWLPPRETPTPVSAPRERMTRHDASLRPNVLILVVDSLRPDRIHGDASGTVVAPRLRALADESAVFTRATTPIARTYGSMASLLTGLHPAHHGVRTLYPDAAARSLAVGALPRRLAGSGYATNAVGGYCATVLREVAFGFDVQRTPTSEIGLVVSLAALRAHPLMSVWLRGPFLREMFPLLRNAVEGERPDDVADEAISAWRRAKGPFFEVVFFGNAHQPYVPVAPEATAAGDYGGPNRYTLKAGDLVEQVRLGETGGTARSDPKEADNLKRLYDGAVHGVDRAAGHVLDALDADGLAESTIVIALADHGENLMDGGGPLAHGEAVERDDSNAIPLSFRWPGRIPPRRIDTPVSLMDVAPTLAHALGTGDQPSDGISLWPALSSGAALPSDRGFLLETCIWFFAKEQAAHGDPSGRALSYPDFTHGLLEIEPGNPPHIVVAPAWRDTVLKAKQRRLDRGRWSLTYFPRDDGAMLRLFDRETDPFLQHDLAAEHPDVAAAMTRAFYDEVTRVGDRSVVPPEPPAAPTP
jgi:arylsulfatase A-like enzyme